MSPIILMIAAAALAGCSSDEPEVEASSTTIVESNQPAPNSVEYFRQVVGDRVFFDTDRYDLDATSQSTLSGQAQWLNSNPATNVVIEGHADERGTRAYNLALGARRAASVRNYLVAQGVSADRIRTVSYGKERPIALGSDPSSWAQNRRAVSVVAGAPSS
ncbi:peptidoglycan-associated lipoprotein Pal [Rhodobacteraceae bacterium NNCM2]|nr:peptidoglycan-associated lipoprotein Pal [Coraliihabitans acroporae]